MDSNGMTDGFKMRRGAIEAGVPLITDIKTGADSLKKDDRQQKEIRKGGLIVWGRGIFSKFWHFLLRVNVK